MIALIDGNSIRRNALQSRLRDLGYFSSGFELPYAELNARLGENYFSCAIYVFDGGRSSFLKMRGALENSNIPLLIVTLQENLGALASLERNALDCMEFDAVPLTCSDRELVWRLEFLLRRTERIVAEREEIRRGPYFLSKRNKTAWVDGKKVDLQPLQFILAFEFFKNLNSILTRRALYSALWGDSDEMNYSRRLDACVSAVRRKLKICPANGFVLRSIYGRGYELFPISKE